MNKKTKLAIISALERDLLFHNKNLTKKQFYTIDAVIETIKKDLK